MTKFFMIALLPMLVGAATKKANIVMLLTDDQDTRLGSFIAMPKTMEYVGMQGANLSNFFIHTPICCPSRTTLLSGRYVHNNRVNTNTDPGCMRMNTSRTTNPDYWSNTFVNRLHEQHGYTTGLFGKVLNNMDTYGCTPGYESLPPGVDRLMIMCTQTYVDAKWADFSNNSALSNNTVGVRPDYTTSLVGNSSLAWIKSIVESGPNHPPFFAYMGPHAPHLPSTPAPWYLDHPVGKTPVPKEVYYNYPGDGKHPFGTNISLAAQNPEINAADAAAIALEHSNRLKTLVSVDDIVAALHDYLVSVNEWDNTYVLTASDHGYSLGQFRIDSHKTQVWDHNTRIPMFMKGPGITPGSVFAPITSMVDLAPTILELAAGGFDPSSVPAEMDGASFAPMITNTGSRPWKNAALIEYQSIRDSVVLAMDEAASISAYGLRLNEHGIPKVQFHPHDGPNNTFAALRFINTTAQPPVDMLYSEFFDVTDPLAWHFEQDRAHYYELYDVTNDYYMLKNIYASASTNVQKTLSDMLQQIVQCKGNIECPSLLH